MLNMNKMVFRYILLIFIGLLSGICALAQSSYYNHIDYYGDTVKLLTISSPTICDCIKKDYRNKDQKRICDRSYDYDFMSEEEREAYNKQVRICRNPSICDCVNADMSDKGLLKQCDENFNYKGISTKRLQEIEDDIKKCREEKDIEELQVCDCINIREDYIQEQCDEKYFHEDLSDHEKQKIALQMKQCVEDTAYRVHVNICDCALESQDDDEIKKACNDKYNTSKMDSTALTEYLIEINYCRNNQVIEDYITTLNLPEDSSFTSICNCMHLSEDEIEEKENCLRQWDLSKMKESEVKAFRGIATSCNELSNTNELTICLCMFEVYSLNDDVLLKKCERYLETISEKEMKEFFKNGMNCDD